MIKSRNEAYTTTSYKTIYTTSDGKDFDNEWRAREHEAKLQQGKYNIKEKVIDTFETEDPAHLYYIDSLDAYTYMTNIKWWDYTPDTYVGPGWYLNIWHDGGDGADWNEVYYMPTYLEDMKSWIKNVEEQMNI